jgi:hypothetical protein
VLPLTLAGPLGHGPGLSNVTKRMANPDSEGHAAAGPEGGGRTSSWAAGASGQGPASHHDRPLGLSHRDAVTSAGPLVRCTQCQAPGLGHGDGGEAAGYDALSALPPGRRRAARFKFTRESASHGQVPSLFTRLGAWAGSARRSPDDAGGRAVRCWPGCRRPMTFFHFGTCPGEFVARVGLCSLHVMFIQMAFLRWSSPIS